MLKNFLINSLNEEVDDLKNGIAEVASLIIQGDDINDEELLEALFEYVEFIDDPWLIAHESDIVLENALNGAKESDKAIDFQYPYSLKTLLLKTLDSHLEETEEGWYQRKKTEFIEALEGLLEIVKNHN